MSDKINICLALDELGVSFIEAGNPFSNPKDIEFFKAAAGLKLKNAVLTAFGSTRRKNAKCAEDANLNALAAAGTEAVSIFGKSWDFHVTDILKATKEENLAMIGESVAYLKALGKTVVYDAEHFFDGYKNNREYALQTVRAGGGRGRGRRVALRYEQRVFPERDRRGRQGGESGDLLPRSACMRTTIRAAAWRIPWKPFSRGRSTCRARSSATANAAETPTFPPSYRICS